MKTVAVSIAALFLFTAMLATAQTESKSASGASAKPKLMNLTGTISQDGKTFTTDKDNKEYTLKNPEAVKGHEGHHVVLNAHVYPDTNELHVMKVTMAKAKGGSKS